MVLSQDTLTQDPSLRRDCVCILLKPSQTYRRCMFAAYVCLAWSSACAQASKLSRNLAASSLNLINKMKDGYGMLKLPADTWTRTQIQGCQGVNVQQIQIILFKARMIGKASAALTSGRNFGDQRQGACSMLLSDRSVRQVPADSSGAMH